MLPPSITLNGRFKQVYSSRVRRLRGARREGARKAVHEAAAICHGKTGMEDATLEREERQMKFRPPLKQQIRASVLAQELMAGRKLPEARAGVKARYGVDMDAVHVKRAKAKRDGPSEHQEQAAVIKWWWLAHRGYNLPLFALFAIPNGGARDPITGSLLKAEGVRKGVPDLMLAAPIGALCGLFLELKVGDNIASEEQQQMVDYFNRAGYKASVHWTSESAIVAIQQYLA